MSVSFGTSASEALQGGHRCIPHARLDATDEVEKAAVGLAVRALHGTERVVRSVDLDVVTGAQFPA